MQRLALLSPLRNKPFRLLFLGQVISDLGDWLDYLAIVVLIVYYWHLGPFALAAFSIAMFLPIAVVGPFAGVWVDRWSHRSTMITCDLIRAVLVIGLVWVPNIYVALLIVVASVTTSTFFGPSRQALIRSTVPDDELLAANSLSQLSSQAAKVVGPALGGLLVVVGGPRVAFIGDALSFLASAVVLSQLSRVATTAAGSTVQEKGNFWQEFRAGFTYIFQHRALMIAITSMGAALFIVFTFDTLGALALQDLGFNASLLGFAVGSIGLGTALGAIVIGQWAGRFSPLRIMASGEVVAGLMVAIIGGAVILHIKTLAEAWIILWLITGLAGAAMLVPYGFILQKETEPQFMGRVASTANGIQTAFLLLSPVVGATVANFFGVGIVFSVAGVGLALLGACMLLVRLPSGPSQSATILVPTVETEVS